MALQPAIVLRTLSSGSSMDMQDTQLLGDDIPEFDLSNMCLGKKTIPNHECLCQPQGYQGSIPTLAKELWWWTACSWSNCFFTQLFFGWTLMRWIPTKHKANPLQGSTWIYRFFLVGIEPIITTPWERNQYTQQKWCWNLQSSAQHPQLPLICILLR